MKITDPDVIKNGENGILVDPSKPEEFADAMIKLIKNKDLSEKIGMQAYKTCQEEFSWEAIADRFLKFYLDFY